MQTIVADQNGTPIGRTRNYNPSHDTYVRVVDHNLPYDTHNLYDVTFHTDTIQTLLTSDPSLVDSWISDILRIHRRRLSHLIVGLDIEWRPNTRYYQNPVATLQLCVGRRCLVFQILHAPFIPQSLRTFLGDYYNFTFVGVGIEEDVEKLLEDYALSVANFLDLRSLAAETLGDPQLNQAGVKILGLRVLGREVQKPQRVTRSRWDNLWLNAEQVQYATIDAFVSFEVGRRLTAYNGN